MAYAQRETQTSTLIHRHSPYRSPWCGRSTVTAIGTALQRKRQRGAHGVDVGFTE
jgi:hypothetical protein